MKEMIQADVLKKNEPKKVNGKRSKKKKETEL